MEKLYIILFWTLVFLYRPCHADTNSYIASQCSEAGNSTTLSSFHSNLVTVLDSLSTNGPTHNGFYRKTAGKGENKVSGLVQCRGDVSSADCYDCIQESINATSKDSCLNSKNVEVWFQWCFLRYWNDEFVGMGTNSFLVSNDTLDGLGMEMKGFDFMQSLADSATMAPYMFQTGVLEAGENETRYGMAQCIRDISKDDCRKCFNDPLESYLTLIDGKRNWEIYSSRCSMRYHDYRFYFNYSIPAVKNDAKTSLVDRSTVVLSTAVLTLMLVM